MGFCALCDITKGLTYRSASLGADSLKSETTSETNSALSYYDYYYWFWYYFTDSFFFREFPEDKLN